MIRFFIMIFCNKFRFQIFDLQGSYSFDLIAYLVITAGPQIWTKSKSSYDNLTIQFKKLMILKMISEVCQNHIYAWLIAWNFITSSCKAQEDVKLGSQASDSKQKIWAQQKCLE